IERGYAHQPANLGQRNGAPAAHFHDGREGQGHPHRPNRPDDAGPYTKPQKMPLELPGDKAIGGTDEVQDLDDLAVGGHGAAGGGYDDWSRRSPHQHEDGEPAEGEGAGDGTDLLLPATMVVQRYALE